MDKRTMGFILMMVLLVFCVSSIGEETPKTDFTIEELLADYDQLWDIMDNSYPFLPVLAERGLGPEALRQDNRALIGSRVTDLKGFCWLLGDMFHQMENLAHLEAVSADIFKTYQSLAEQYDLPEKALFFDPRTQATYSNLGADDKADLYDQYLPVQTKYYPEISAAYFRFPSFQTSIIDKDDSLISDYLAGYPDVQHVIIDITGNAGSNTDYWQYTIVSAFAEWYEWNNLSFVRITPLSAPFYHDERLQPVSALPDGFRMPDFADALGMTHYAAWRETYPKADYAGRQITAPLRRWLLVDEGVFSAAESFAGFCKSTGWAALVGRITRGGGARVRGPIMIRLNNTGLLARFTAESAVNEDSSPNAVTGTIPDYPCKPGETPLEICLRLIRHLP